MCIRDSDLRDRFVVGAGNSYSVGAIGGTADAVVVSHSHTASSSVSDPGHSHGIEVGSDTGNNVPRNGGPVLIGLSTTIATTGISVSTSVSATGSSGTGQNLPPYYALAYIMKA